MRLLSLGTDTDHLSFAALRLCLADDFLFEKELRPLIGLLRHMSSCAGLQVGRLGESEITAMEHRQQLIGLDHLPQIGMHLGHPPTHEGRNIRQRVFVRPYDAGKGTVGTKCRSSDRLHRHTGPGDFVRREPNKTCLARRTVSILLSAAGAGARSQPMRDANRQHAEEDPARHTQTASQARMTLVSICTSARRNDHASHLFFSLLEWTAHGPLKPRERQGEFEARQIVIHSDLALDPLGIENIQEAGGALAEAQLGDTKRFLRLL